jgi:hypothetical protein
MAYEQNPFENNEQENVEQEQDVPSEADLSLSSKDFGLGEAVPQQHQGQNRSPRQIESQTGRKPGTAKRTAGAKRQATRSAKGGALKKSKGRKQGQKSGKQKTSKKRPMAGKSAAQRRRRKAA